MATKFRSAKVLSISLANQWEWRRTNLRRAILAVAAITATCDTLEALAFPPYRTTDAETAGDDTLEVRIGLLRLQVNDSHSTRKAPLSRINYGIGPRLEVISELEYAIDEREMDEGALGFKWAKLEEGRGIGVETLLLLPVRSELDGVGIESQLIRTWQQERYRVHVNAGAFYDPRDVDTDYGWRGSALAEFPRGKLRPGVELFARDSDLTETRLQAGVGLIASLERVEIRTGLHVGLNDAAPDLEASVWLSWKWRVPKEQLP
jgi:hypothetical protein